MFDGCCGFCTRCAQALRRLDRAGRIEIVPFQSPGAPESVGATPDQCRAAVQWRGRDGRRRQGADAVDAALSVLTRTPLPSLLYRVTAGPQERAYRWVADHRHRLPGTTPHCSEHPADCDPTPTS